MARKREGNEGRKRERKETRKDKRVDGQKKTKIKSHMNRPEKEKKTLECSVLTITKVGQRLQDPPSESSHGVLDTGAQTEHALEVGLFQQ